MFAGVAAAGAAFWMAATTGPDVATATPEVRLTSAGSPMLAPVAADCPTLVCANLIGLGATAPTPGPLFAAMLAPSGTAQVSSSALDPISALISVFVSNGTAERPNAGLLIGNGFNGAAGQNGGSGGLLFGSGGKGGAGVAGVNGGKGANGGNAGLFGDGGSGGSGGTGGSGTSGPSGTSGSTGSPGTSGSVGDNGTSAGT